MSVFKKSIFNVDKKLFADYIVVFAGSGAARALSLVISFIVVRLLTVIDFGLYSMYYMIMILTWQLPNLIDLTYVRYIKAEDGVSKTAYLSAFFYMKAGIFCILIIVAYPMALLLTKNFMNKPDLLFFVLMGIISGAFLSFFSTLSGIYQAEENFVKFSFVNSLFYVFLTIVLFFIFLFCHQLTPVTTVWIHTVGAVLLGCITVLILYKKMQGCPVFHSSVISNMLSFGKWLLFANIIHTVVLRLDFLVLAKYYDYAVLGVYSAAIRTMTLASLFSGAVSAVLVPRGSQALKSLSHLISYLKHSLLLCIALTVVIGILFVLCPTFISLFFGRDYLSAVSSSRILLFVPAFIVFYTPLIYLFYAEGNTRKSFDTMVVILITLIIALYFLVPLYGAEGAAFSMAFSHFCGLVYVVFNSVRIIRRAHGYI